MLQFILNYIPQKSLCKNRESTAFSPFHMPNSSAQTIQELSVSMKLALLALSSSELGKSKNVVHK